MAAPTYGASATPDVNATATASVVIDTGLPTRTEDDILIVVVHRATVATSITPPTGFRLAGNINYAGGDVALFAKVITASEPSTYTFSWTGTTRNIGHMFTVTGTPDPTNTLAAEPAGATSGTGSPNPPASGTVASGDYLAIAIGSIEGKSQSFTSLTNYVERDDDFTSGSGGPANHVTGAAYTRELTGITSEDPGTFVVSTEDDWGALTFLVSELTGGPQTLSGVLFSKAPTFIVGIVAGPLLGTVFVKTPTFITGTVTLVKEIQMSGFSLNMSYVEGTGQTVTGVLFSRPPAFISGVVTPGGVTVDGVLFSRPPAFIAGVVTPGGVTVNGVLFSKPPTFISGTVAATFTLVGVLFTKPPSFISGTVTPTYIIVGNLFARPPTFLTGQINLTVSGVVFAAPPTFISGVVTPGGVTLTGVLFARPPTFISGQINKVLSGVVFEKPPTFISGQLDLTIFGALFSKPPTFISGQINLRVFAGATFLKPPTFIPGVVDAGQLLDGVLFSKPPSFIAGVVTPGGVQLDGVLFSRPPAFISGRVIKILSGVLFSRPPSFISGTIAVGNVTVTGVLFTKPPAFISGQVTATFTLQGVLFTRPPTFTSGTVVSNYTLTGILFARPPTFISGQVNLTLLGVVFNRPPTFITGTVTPGGVTVAGVVFTRPPSFISGTIVPSVNLYSTATGTFANVVDELDTTIDMHLSVDDDPSAPNDADWVNNTVLTASVFFDLTDLPGDFTAAESATILIRYRGQEWGAGSLSLRAQLFRSNETTTMSDEVLVDTISANSAFGNSSPITLTNLDTGAGKAIWDAAKIRFRWS